MVLQGNIIDNEIVELNQILDIDILPRSVVDFTIGKLRSSSLSSHWTSSGKPCGSCCTSLKYYKSFRFILFLPSSYWNKCLLVCDGSQTVPLTARAALVLRTRKLI